MLTSERDQFRKETKELIEIKDKIQKEKTVAMEAFKKRVTQMEKDNTKVVEQLETCMNSLQNLDKANKMLTTERQKMIDRIKKLKSRRGKFDEGSKVCKKCGKDFMEKENFNWSCSTHQSEFSGEMWWCCGKTQKEARGCKFSKHEKQDEDEDEDENAANALD